MNATFKLAIGAAVIALVGGSFFMPGPSDLEIEQSVQDWKEEVIQIAKKDQEMLLLLGAFTK